MQCEKCGQKPAVMHMTQYINGNLVETHLCEECAKKGGLGGPISFQDLFQGLINLAGACPEKRETQKSKEDTVKCPCCGMTYEEFRENGRLGCAACYKTFQKNLDVMLKSMHGSNTHKGKIPKRAGGAILAKREKDKLRELLKKAIAEEAFEEAARLRDQIRAMEREA